LQSNSNFELLPLCNQLVFNGLAHFFV